MTASCSFHILNRDRPDESQSLYVHSFTPLYAVVGQLRAGESVRDVAADFGLTVEQVEVVAQLADEVSEWE